MKKINILLAVIVGLAAIFLMLLSTGKLKSMQSGLLSLMSPFLKSGSAVQQGLGAMGKGFKSLDELESDNRRLETENKELRATNQILSDLEAENNRLRSALEYRERSEFRLVPAQIISRDSSTWWNTVLINRGFEDGVDDGLDSGIPMTVITDKGLVGKVLNVQKNTATVLLVTDENCKVGAFVEGTRSKGIVTGMRIQEGGNTELQMNFLEKNANLQPGQKVYTQGVGAVFPPGLPIGTVKSFEPRELDGQAIITPDVDFATLADVFVIVAKRPQ